MSFENPWANITGKHFDEFDAPSLEPPPAGPAMKRQREKRQDELKDGDEYFNKVSGSSGQVPLKIEAPMDGETQGTYDHLD